MLPKVLSSIRSINNEIRRKFMIFRVKLKFVFSKFKIYLDQEKKGKLQKKSFSTTSKKKLVLF